MVNIYRLLDPDTLNVKYVGKTTEPLNRRLNKHIYNRKNQSKVSKWCRKLFRNNKKPKIELIEKVDESIWAEKEKYWISYYKNLGCDLMNLLPGGQDQHRHFKHTEKAKKQIGLKNKRPKSKEWIKNAAEAMKKVRCKPINQYDKNGLFINTYNSFPEAGKSVWNKNVPSAIKNIHACCNFKRKTAYGYVWRYKNAESKDKEL